MSSGRQECSEAIRHCYNRSMTKAEIGIIGGSGFYHLLPGSSELTVQTPYGATSDQIVIGELGGRRCAFLPRHGRRHHLPAHMVPYRANIFALKELGVLQVIGVTAVGALNRHFDVGDFACADQLVDFTHGRRADTYYDGPIATHVGFGQPYCPQMRDKAIAAASELGLGCHVAGTIVVTNGPRFSTYAESRFFAAQGWDLENMTQYPEVVLARELGLSYLNLSLVTNSHVRARERGSGEMAAASDVIAVLRDRLEDLLRLLAATVAALPPGDERPGFIRNALQNARWI